MLTSRSPYTVIAAVRGIGVAVITSRSGHRRAGLLPQGGALLHAEAVLLVDHDDAEAVEGDALLDQRVGADGEVDRAVGEPAEDALALGAGDAVGEQLHAQRPIGEQAVALRRDLEVGQQRLDPGGVLLGEDLGRCHQRALVPTFHRRQQRRDGDDRLAGADVALQQAVHRVRRGEVGIDLADHPALGRGEWERQGGEEARHERAVRRRGGSRRRRAPSPACA